MTTTRTRAPKPAERKPARRKAAPKPVEVISEPKPATGPRGELLARVGLAEDGYVIKLPFREFETLRAADVKVATEAGQPVWLTRCVAHGTTRPAATGTEAERAGARAARRTWCKPCAKAASA